MFHDAAYSRAEVGIREDVVSLERREVAAYEILKHPVRQGLRVPRVSRRNEFQPEAREPAPRFQRGLYSIIPGYRQEINSRPSFCRPVLVFARSLNASKLLLGFTARDKYSNISRIFFLRVRISFIFSASV